MFKVSAGALVFILSATLAASAQQQAQPPGLRLTATRDLGAGLQPGRYSLIFLMDYPDILKDLDLSDEQKVKLKDLQKQRQHADDPIENETREKQKKAKADGNIGEFVRLNEILHAVSMELAVDAEKTLTSKILDRRQLARLREIRLQAEGPTAFSRPEVEEKLGLDPEQIEEIRKITVEGGRLVRTASTLSPDVVRPAPGGEETPESRAYAVTLKTVQFRVADARLSTMRSIEMVLTKGQRAAYLKMIGEPFVFLKLPPGPPYRVLAQDKGKVAVVDPSGKVEWEIPLRFTAHDIQLLPNGHILLPIDNVTVVEMTPDRKVVWRHVSRAKEPYKGAVEIHAFQRLPDGRTMIAETGNKRIIEVDAEDRIVKEVPLVVDHPDSHRDTRRARKLANGHYLVCHELDGVVREYDDAGKVVWSYKLDLAGRPPKGGHDGHGTEVFNAIRRPDGNTIIAGGNNNRVFEVDPSGKVVWSVDKNDLPGIELFWVTSLQLRPNGNLIFGNTHAGPNNPQIIEVTRDKKVVWTLHDFKNFGNDLCASQVINVEEGVIR